jgi:hypothetical protein
VGLAELWRLALHLERAWHGRGHRSNINPEEIYEGLGDLQARVEVNCWSRDDQTMLELLKKTGGWANGCSFCDVYSLDSFEFGWSSNTTSCPRCAGRLFDNRPEETRTSKWDGGPTHPEHGDYAYRWAMKHGMMWDEFLETIRGQPSGFDASKKTLCPLLDQCNTRCAQDQKDGVRGWPLGSSDYETSCYKFREIRWCNQTGGTPEQFKVVQTAQLERQLKTKKTKARRERQPKVAAAPVAQERPVLPGFEQEAPSQAPARPVASTPTPRAVRPATPKPSVERPRMF